MRHKLLTLLLALAAGAGTVFAAGVEVDGIWYTFTTKTKTAAVTYEGSSSSTNPDRYTGDVVIPDTVLYNDVKYCVTSIGYDAFQGCQNLTSVKIPNTVTSIEIRAFKSCYGLTAITIPTSVTSIKQSAFEQCTSLSSIEIPEGVTSIDASAFKNCISLTSVTISNTVTSIGTDAFNKCTKLTSIEVPNSVTSLGSGVFGNSGLITATINSATGIPKTAFVNCTSLTSVTIGSGVTSIGEYAFSKCDSLTTIDIPGNVTKIDQWAFNECTGLTSITLGNGLTTIGERTFYNCSNLASIDIPNSVTWLGQYAFQGCTGLTSVTIGDGLETIQQYTFAGCTGLVSATIGNGVTSIQTYAFSNCSSLASIDIPNSVTSIGSNAFRGCASMTSATIGDGVKSIPNYAFMNSSSLTSVKLGNSVASIGAYAFAGCSSLTSIEFPNSLTSIGGSAFNGCAALTSVKIPDSVTSLNGSAFSGCTGLTSFEFPNSITSIENSVLFDCSSLTSVTIPESVTSIGNNAFYNCSSLTSIVIPNGVTSLNGSAFSGCTGLTSVTIGDGVPEIGKRAFYNLDNLVSVTIGKGVRSIGENAFGACDNLPSIIIPDSVKSIGPGAFSGCDNMTAVTIGKGVTSMGESAFSNCSSLTSIVIPDSVTSIESYAFNKCTALTSVTIGKGVTSIGYSSFNGCTALPSVTIPGNVTKIDQWAFNECTGLTSLIIEEGVTSLGEKAFYKCTGLTSVTIPGSVTDFKSQVFERCTGLTSVTINEGVISIGWLAFGDCTALTSVTIANSVTDIRGAFSGCTALNSVTMGYNLTSIGERAFAYCSSLKSVTIPFNVANIDSRAFSNCTGLETIVCEATTPPVCSSNAFEGVSGKTVILVPHEAVADYKAAEVWKNFPNILPLTDEGTVSVTLPKDVPDGYYDDMTLELHNLNSQNVQKRPVLNKREFEFVSQKPGNGYQALLKNSYGQVMGKSEAAALTGAELSLTIDTVLRKKDVSLKVTTPDGTDVTGRVSVMWTDEADKALGYTSELKAMAEGTKLTCKVIIRDELARQYVAPEAAQLTVSGDGGNILAVSLQPLQVIALHGMVKDKQTGEIIADATVALTQQFGDNYQSVTATTDNNGLYELQGTNGQGELSATASGYLPKTVNYDAPASEGTLPAIEMERFDGIIVKTWFTYTEAAAEGTEGKFTDDYDPDGDVAWQVYNKTTGAAVENFIIKENGLYFTTDVSTGDEVIVTASSHNNKFSPVSDTCEIANSGLAFVTLPIVQKGGLEATANTDKSSSVMGVLYDANGRFVRSITYRFGKLSLAGLTAGDYTLISMTTNILLGRVLLLSTFSNMGLVDGRDYVKNAVHIEDGRIVTVNVADVPELDTEKLQFTTPGSYFIADKNVINVGQYMMITSKVEFAEQFAERVENVELLVDIPEGIDFVENSVILGSHAGNYRIEDGHYIFPIENMAENQIKLCLTPKQTGEFRISGFVRFRMDGVLTLQPVGTVWLQAKGFTMSAAMFTSPINIYVSGTAPLIYKGNTIEVYDYDRLVGSAKVGKDGMWSLDIKQPSDKANVHAIKARMTIPGVSVIESETKYISNNKVITGRVEMICQNYLLVGFDYYGKSNRDICPECYPGHFYPWIPANSWDHHIRLQGTPPRCKFTFRASFEDMNIPEDKKVKIAILQTDGTTRTLDTEHNSGWEYYYASTSYPTTSKLPLSAYAFYEIPYAAISEEEQSAMDEELERTVAKVTHEAVRAAKTKGETEVLPDDGETLNLKYTISGKEPLAFSMKEMDYDSATAYVMKYGPLFYRGDDGEGNIVYTFVNGEEEAEMVLIDVEGHYALRTEITYAEIDDLGAVARRKAGQKRIKVNPKLFAAGAGSLGSNLLTAFGLMDYINAPGQLQAMIAWRAAIIELSTYGMESVNELLARECTYGDVGKPRFTDEQKVKYLGQIIDWSGECDEVGSQLKDFQDAFMEDFYKKEAVDIATTLLGGGLGKRLAQGAAIKLGPKAVALFEKAGTFLDQDNVKVVTSWMGCSKDMLKSGLLGNMSFDQWLGIDFGRHYKEFMDSLEKKKERLKDEFLDQYQDMLANQQSCDKDEEECEGDDCEPEEDECEEYDFECPKKHGFSDEEDEEDDDHKRKPPYPSFPTYYLEPIIDPSGYAYEAVPSNRVEGATAIIYYKDGMLDENGNSTGGTDVMWDAENYGQINPQITGADGMYQWDVPQGLWQVRVSKDGYENNNSDWLPVPPPQLDVNIPIIRNRLPQVEKAHAYEDAVTVKFDSYMLPEYLNTELITVTENGAAVAGTIELTDEEAAPDSATYASKLRFIPSKAFTAAQVTLNISGLVQSYSGIEMDVPFEAILPIERELKQLVADVKMKVKYENTGVIHVKGEPAAAAAGKTVRVQCASGIITSTTQTSVVLNQNGEADVTVQGDLPGTDIVSFTMDEPELTANTLVIVFINSDVHVDVPEASVPTETAVEKGTQVTLNCKTEGAEIYYTLDGSDPSNSGTRIRYDAPIAINEEITLKAVAVLEGKGESEVVTWHYTVKVGTQLTNLAGSEGKVTPVRVHDSFEVTGVEGTFSVSIYSMSGKLLMKIEQMQSGRRVNASALQTGIHLVVVNGEGAYFTQRIIKD